MIRVVHPGSGSQILIFTHAGSRGQQSTGSWIRNTVTRNLNLYHPAKVLVLYRKGSEIFDVPGTGTHTI